MSEITAPVLLWYGRDDVFSPASHTLWLAEHICNAKTELKSGVAHFGSIEILPETLIWLADTMNAARRDPAAARHDPILAERTAVSAI